MENRKGSKYYQTLPCHVWNDDDGHHHCLHSYYIKKICNIVLGTILKRKNYSNNLIAE